MTAQVDPDVTLAEFTVYELARMCVGEPSTGEPVEHFGRWSQAVEWVREANQENGAAGALLELHKVYRIMPMLFSEIYAAVLNLVMTDPAVVVRTAQTTAGPERVWLTEEELDMLPPPEWVLRNEIAARAITMLYGPSGVGKTFIALQHYALPIAQDGAVLYVAAEDVEGVRIRKNAWRSLHKTTGGALYVWPEEINLLDAAASERFLLQIRGLSLRLIVIDTLAQCSIGADDSSNREMGIFMDTCKRIIRATGAALLVIHHTGKNGLDYRGASALKAACYTVIEAADEDGAVKLTCTKAKNSRPFEPVLLQLIPHGQSAVMVPYSKVSTREIVLTVTQRKVLEAAALAIFAQAGASLSDFSRATGVPDPTLYRALSTLKRVGYLSQDAKGHPYRITPAGRSALSPDYIPVSPEQGAGLSQLSNDNTDLSDSSDSPSHQLSITLSPPLGGRVEVIDSWGGESRDPESEKNGTPGRSPYDAPSVMGFDWATVRRYYAAGDEVKIRLHCHLWREDAAAVLEQLRVESTNGQENEDE